MKAASVVLEFGNYIIIVGACAGVVNYIIIVVHTHTLNQCVCLLLCRAAAEWEW